MGAFIEQLGMQTANAATGGIFGHIFGGMNDDRQYKQQERLQELQMAGQRAMTDYEWQKQMEMWKATNYPAQLQMMKQAGLSPGLIYGKGGGGGTTTGNASGHVQGATAPTGGGEIMHMISMGLMDAQRKNIEADTKLKETQAGKTAGVDTREAETRILDLTQGINNKKAEEGLKKVETMLKNIELDVQGATAEERKDQIIWNSLRALEELDQVARQTYIQKATMNSIIDKARAEATGAVLRNILTEAQTDETKQKIEKTIQEINLIKDQLYKTNPVQRQAISNQIANTWRVIEQHKDNDGQSLIDAILKLTPIK